MNRPTLMHEEPIFFAVCNSWLRLDTPWRRHEITPPCQNDEVCVEDYSVSTARMRKKRAGLFAAGIGVLPD